MGQNNTFNFRPDQGPHDWSRHMSNHSCSHGARTHNLLLQNHSRGLYRFRNCIIYVLTLRELNYIKQFTHLRLCLASAIHNLKWVKCTCICTIWIKNICQSNKFSANFYLKLFLFERQIKIIKTAIYVISTIQIFWYISFKAGALVQWFKLPALKVGDCGYKPRSGIQVSKKQNVSSLFPRKD